MTAEQTTSPDVDTERKRLYAPPKSPVMVTVPPLNFLMLDGQGDPNTAPAFAEAIEALFSLSYTLRFALKKEGVIYSVGPLEGLWWSDDMSTFSVERKADWNWTLMIVQPDAVTPERFAWARDEVTRKKALTSVAKVRLERFDEGLCAQVMHVGPFSEEGPTIARLHEFIHAQGYSFEGAGKHHEIYLSDIRRGAPERWKTVIRQPVGARAA